jgi:hypothetical protein
MATVYPSDMPPSLACQELVTNIYIWPHYCGWHHTLLVFRVLCTLVFWEPYTACMIHWTNKRFPILLRHECHALSRPVTFRTSTLWPCYLVLLAPIVGTVCTDVTSFPFVMSLGHARFRVTTLTSLLTPARYRIISVTWPSKVTIISVT